VVLNSLTSPFLYHFKVAIFLMEPGDPPLITVIIERMGKVEFEIEKNKPVENRFTAVTTNQTGIVTVSHKESGNFIYKVRPGSETSVVFGRLKDNNKILRITDKKIFVYYEPEEDRSLKDEDLFFEVENGKFNGYNFGIIVKNDGSVEMGSNSPIPDSIKEFLGQRP